MEKKQANEMASWLAKVAERYNRPILVVTDQFKKAMDKHSDINLAKLNVVKECSKC